MVRNTSQTEANGLTIKGTPNVVWAKGEETTQVFTRTELRSKANVVRK
jgi:hypothetical protein